jgi:hypothetical protein
MSILGKVSHRIHIGSLQSSGARFEKWEMVAGFSAKGQSPQENPMLYSSIRVDVMQQLLIHYVSGDERLVIPDWAGELSDAELTFIQERLRRSRRYSSRYRLNNLGNSTIFVNIE